MLAQRKFRKNLTMLPAQKSLPNRMPKTFVQRWATLQASLAKIARMARLWLRG